MTAVRAAAVAGTFYPGDRSTLRSAVREHLEAVSPRHREGRLIKALIAPHAGYLYSGPIAGSAFRLLEAERDCIERVILLGPPHRFPVRGLALPGVDGFETPLGVVPVDDDLVGQIDDMPQVEVSRAAHAPEHSLEVELPFLQEALGEFSILPLLVGTEMPDEVAQVLDRVWGGPETRIVISSDLSHYLAYDLAQRIDRETTSKILALEASVSHRRACGADAVNGFLVAARRFGLEPELLDLRNSGDTAGDRSQVVGYAAVAFYEMS